MNVTEIIKKKTDSKLNPYECAMLNDFVLYNIYADIAEIEKWSIEYKSRLC